MEKNRGRVIRSDSPWIEDHSHTSFNFGALVGGMGLSRHPVGIW